MYFPQFFCFKIPIFLTKEMQAVGVLLSSCSAFSLSFTVMSLRSLHRFIAWKRISFYHSWDFARVCFLFWNTLYFDYHVHLTVYQQINFYVFLNACFSQCFISYCLYLFLTCTFMRKLNVWVLTYKGHKISRFS